ncbi:sugar ABC transporter substrate-binding protein [Frankia sp. Cr1]|uniref:ABC transporter substrate-binding protein n=1 Tax=Frankia sp. Cr1 TaxID=3073931 RepID=UPI002AD52D2A|nr:sugar ABC transporter substrate-binding protein [Frankia sp. Cr1]
MRGRRLAALVLSGVLFAVAAACGGGGEDANKSSGTVNLTYRLWDSTQQVGYQKSIDEFQRRNPNIKVTIQQMGWADYWTKTIADFAAGTAPDVFWNHVSYFPQFAAQGVLLNLTPRIKQDNFDTTIYYESLVESYRYDGAQYGIPKDWDTVALVCDSAALNKAGVSNPGKLTWATDGSDTLLPFLQKLTVDKNGKNITEAGFDAGNVQRYGLLANNTLQQGWGAWAVGNGGSLMDKSYGKLTLDSPQAIQGIQAYVDLVTKYRVAPPGSQTNNRDSDLAQFLASGQVACVTAGDWQLSALTKQSSTSLTILPPPSGPNGSVSAFNGLADSITARSKHPQEAWELVKWLGSLDSQKIIGSGGYAWPAIKSIDNTFVEYWKTKKLDVQPYLDAAQGKTFSYPLTRGWNGAQIELDKYFNQIFTGQLSVAEGVPQAVRQANEAIRQAG